MKLEYSPKIFRKKKSKIKFHENPMGDELFHADRQTHMT